MRVCHSANLGICEVLCLLSYEPGREKNACGCQEWKTQDIVVALTSIISSTPDRKKYLESILVFLFCKLSMSPAPSAKIIMRVQFYRQEFPSTGISFPYLLTTHQWRAQLTGGTVLFLKIKYVSAAVSSARRWHQNWKSLECEWAKHIFKSLSKPCNLQKHSEKPCYYTVWAPSQPTKHTRHHWNPPF